MMNTLAEMEIMVNRDRNVWYKARYSALSDRDVTVLRRKYKKTARRYIKAMEDELAKYNNSDEDEIEERPIPIVK